MASEEQVEEILITETLSVINCHMYGDFEKDCRLKENKCVNYAQEGDESFANNFLLSYGKIENIVKDV